MTASSQTGVNFINILRTPFCRYYFAKKITKITVIREKLRKALMYKKGARKMLTKLTTGKLFEAAAAETILDSSLTTQSQVTPQNAI